MPSVQTRTPMTPFQALKKRLWIGTLSIHALLLAATAIWWPERVGLAVAGILMGVFYLWSLAFNAEHPRKGVQSLFSLVRMVLLAWMVVKLSHLRLPELALVMSGLLSYKLMLMIEYATQILPVFKSRVRQ